MPSVRASLATGLVVLFAFAAPASAASPDVVISQVYGGGGNPGATYKNDFIELFNRGTSAVNVGNWSVQYASAAGTAWQTTSLTGTIPPGGRYLVQEAAGSGGTLDLPTPDATGSILMSAGSGKVALVTAQSALACGSACAGSASVWDFVGYGTASDSEGAATPVLTNTTAALRLLGGCTDTDDNSLDFAVGAPSPRNSASAATPCAAPPTTPPPP
jgi:predicted extracellular nuclease